MWRMNVTLAVTDLAAASSLEGLAGSAFLPWALVALALLVGPARAAAPPVLLLARYSREKDLHPGGVPKFSWYFRQCFPEAEEVVVSDLPAAETDSKGEPALTEALGAWVQHRYRGQPPIVVADGYWGRGLPDHWRVICVAHGTWEAIGWRTDSAPPRRSSAPRARRSRSRSSWLRSSSRPPSNWMTSTAQISWPPLRISRRWPMRRWSGRRMATCCSWWA